MKNNIVVGIIGGVLSVELLSGCSTAIDLTRLNTPTTAEAICKDVNQLIEHKVNGPGGPSSSFRFVTPVAASWGSSSGPGGPALTQTATFKDYSTAVDAAKANLPSTIRNHSVTNALVAVVTRASAQGQVNRGKALGWDVSSQQAEIDSFSIPSSISNDDLQDFADKFFDAQLAPKLASAHAAPGGDLPASQLFATYFESYYQGNFYDRLGENIAKPSRSLQIKDSDIAAALTVLLEYTADLVDSTPVLGDKDFVAEGKPDPNTTYYPGKSKNEPTVLTAKAAHYINISKNNCGVTEATAPLLANLANSASDRAAAMSGLASQSWGGFEVGLGFLGKFSVGDNQTLATIVKTTASRVALRATLAASYWAVDSLGKKVEAGAGPGGAASPTEGTAEKYLRFPNSR